MPDAPVTKGGKGAKGKGAAQRVRSSEDTGAGVGLIPDEPASKRRAATRIGRKTTPIEETHPRSRSRERRSRLSPTKTPTTEVSPVREEDEDVL